MRAALDGDIDALYELIAQDPHALDYSDSQPFILTPLHIAVAEGNTNFALEIIKLYPFLSNKLDPNGWCPFHVALLNYQIATEGRDLTSLHLVVEFLDGIQHNLLREFLAVSPLSITDTTNQGQTALHIAVNKGNTEALKVLLSILRRSMYRNALYWEHKVLNWKDENGDTVLHVAVVKSLLKCNIDVNAKSLEGLTVLDIVDGANNNPDMKDVLIEAGAKHSHVMNTNDINSIPSMKQLVVAALVATATFQAVLSPLGGLRQADGSDSDSLPFSKVGKVVMKEWLYITFLILNSTSFWVTIITIYLLLPTGFYGQLLTLPLILFSITYLFCSTIISPSLVCAIGVVLLSNRSLLSYVKKLWPRCR
ncbi:hypothetical protein ERO13_D03G167150v2 [Gossypium hirsutum]|nr:hypothetical protein ERO13_D03G167150v2 [Gossypium hirsutum]